MFGELFHVKQINPVKATVQPLADFLIFLFEEKKLAISSIQGYRSCISKVFLARGIDISHDRDLNMLVRNFLAKTMDPSRPETDYAPVTIPALGPSMGEDLPDRLLCPVRALRYYLKLKHKGQDPNNRFRRLLCAIKLGHTGDISKQTVSGWIRQLIKQAYSAVQDKDIPHLTHTNFQARELRAFASSLAFHQNYSWMRPLGETTTRLFHSIWETSPKWGM